MSVYKAKSPIREDRRLFLLPEKHFGKKIVHFNHYLIVFKLCCRASYSNAPSGTRNFETNSL